MSTALFANNAATTLASAVSTSATSITLLSGAGAKFPNPASGQFFSLTLISATTSTTFENTYCTARSGDVLTIERAQEGTTALAFNAGDLAQNLPTAGTVALMGQLGAPNAWTGTNTFDSTVVIPNAAASNEPVALGQAEVLFGQLAATNTWTGANTFTASGTNPAQIELSQTGGGHNWFVIADHSGNLSFYDGTAVASRFSVSPAGVVNFSLPPAIPNGTVSDNPVALGQIPALFPSAFSGGSGYKKYPDPNSPSGYFIEQWANGSVAFGTTPGIYSGTFNLLLAFPNAVVSTSVSYQGSGPSQYLGAVASQANPSYPLSLIDVSIYAIGGGGGNAVVTFMAKGY